MASSIDEGCNADGVLSDQPMLSCAFAKNSDSYNHRLQTFARKGRYMWLMFVGSAVLVLFLLICGAVALIYISSEGRITPRSKIPAHKASITAPRPKDEKRLRFEYQTADRRKEQVIINVKENYTELFAEDVTVFNYFRRRISLHRIEIAPSKRICLIKMIRREVSPGELEKALPEIHSIEVNSTELYIIDTVPVPDDIQNDITVHQFCDRLHIYPLKLVNETGPDVGLTMEQLIKQFVEKRPRRQATSNPLDQHNGGPYHCGGPIGSGEPVPALEYKCTRKKTYCYRSLVKNCDECYHGHNLRTRGCWCPINAIQTCIKISYKPDKRFCCGLDAPPCVREQCDTRRIPFLPPPEITFKIVTD